MASAGRRLIKERAGAEEGGLARQRPGAQAPACSCACWCVQTDVSVRVGARVLESNTNPTERGAGVTCLHDSQPFPV